MGRRGARWTCGHRAFRTASPMTSFSQLAKPAILTQLNQIANWRMAWNNATRAVECPKCGRLQLPTDSCRNAHYEAEMRGIISPLERLRFHDLRHSAATKMLENGVPIATVAQVLGWSASTAIRMAKRYSHIRPEAQRQALESIATALPSIMADERKADFAGEPHQVPHQVRNIN